MQSQTTAAAFAHAADVHRRDSATFVRYDTPTGKLIEETADVTEDGRIDVYLDSRLSRALSKLVPKPNYDHDRPPTPPPKYEAFESIGVRLNIVIQVVGSRGDVQPFIALGNELQKHGHRVRLATHDVFESFVTQHGLEFYPIGGDPAELMAFMVKNPSLIPSMSSVMAGDIQAKRKMITTMLKGCWNSCIEADPRTGVPFTADAIIANPPSFAHIHCAQALGCPVHIMFTMPWSCTNEFPHPLANLKMGSNKTVLKNRNSNYLSYIVVEWLTWQGLGDVINNWRKSMDLEPVPESEGPLLAETLKIPFTYCWSPALVAKPRDWPSHIDVCGFFFREAPTFDPPFDLRNFLERGPPPVYIGFGSIVIDNPDAVTAMILEAVEVTGVRAIVSRGWSNLGAGQENGEKVFYLGDCPHEWLFQHVAAVIHHGGAGTTACGLFNGRPTTIVPFFGDQPFWGNMVAAAGAGPLPIPYKSLSTQKIADAIRFCLKPGVLSAASGMAHKMQAESGVKTAVESFHRGLPPRQKLQCDILPDQPASWIYEPGKRQMKLSKIAAQALSNHLKIDLTRLKVYEPAPITIEISRWDPLTGVTSAGFETYYNMLNDAVGIVTKPIDEYKQSKEEQGQSHHHPNSSIVLAQSHSPHSTQNRQEYGLQLRPHPAGRTKSQTAGAMAVASAKSFGNALGRPLKGAFVDGPLALTDGLYSVPKLYGSEVQERKKITNFKSGVTVAGTSFVLGILGGVSDLVVEPYQGGKKEGAIGVVKGVGKGALGLITKTGAASIGLLAYPGQGACKSLYASYHAQTRALIVQKRMDEGAFLFQGRSRGWYNEEVIIRTFDNIRSGAVRY